MCEPATPNYSGAVYVCQHVASGIYPPLQVEIESRDHDLEAGWQVLCNSGEDEDLEQWQIWSLREVIDAFPSLTNFVSTPPETTLLRDSPQSEWYEWIS